VPAPQTISEDKGSNVEGRKFSPKEHLRSRCGLVLAIELDWVHVLSHPWTGTTGVLGSPSAYDSWGLEQNEKV
jgi:hypothetical protein